MAVGKHYPTDERGLVDAGDVGRPPMLCARPLILTQRLEGPFITWCCLPDGHLDDCSYPWPRDIPTNEFKPARKT